MPADTRSSEEVRALKDRAALLLGRGKRDAALAQLKRALALAPGDLFARQKVAELLVRSGHTREALDHYLALVGRYSAEEHWLKAIAVANVMLGLDPDHRETHELLAKLVARSDAAPRPSLPAPMRAAIVEPPAPAALRTIPLFSALDATTLAELLPRLERRLASPGESIVAEGEIGDAMFAIVSGSVRVERRSGSDALPRVVATMGEGAFFGEMALLVPAPRFASVVAATDTELLVLRKPIVDELVRKSASVHEIVVSFYKSRLVENLLRASPMFHAARPELARRLADAAYVGTFPVGESLVRESERVEGLYVLLRGECDVVHRTEPGEHAMPTMGEGDLFGEIALLGDGLASATVRTRTPCVVLGFHTSALAPLLDDPALREALGALSRARLERSRDALSGALV